MKNKRYGFTLIELIAVLVILAIIALLATPLVMNIIRKAKISARKRSVDAYGRSVELAIAGYLMDTGTFPTNEQLPNLKIEYSGSDVVCNVMQMNKKGGLYLSQCKVNNIEVKDSNDEDGYYHYGTRDLTNSEIIEMYGKAVEQSLKEYHDINNVYPNSINDLVIDYTGESVSCDVEIYGDGAIYMTKCSISGIEIKDNTEDGYYHYGTRREKIISSLLSKTNDISITNYTDGNIHEMYTFEHPATEQTSALTDYRYIGSDPYNYVLFNNELWRIIGVFTVEDENGNKEERIKIIKNEKLSNNMTWDSNNSNEWSTATLNTYLNGDYYNGLDATSKSMITDTKYYLGGSNTNSGGAETYYSWERGSTVYNGRSISWLGKIALMYPSDYSYTYALGADDTCYTDGYNCGGTSGKTNGWIYNANSNFIQWVLSANSSNLYSSFYLGDSGYVGLSTAVTYSIGFRPVVYLSSNVKIVSGTGKSDDPYNLSL